MNMFTRARLQLPLSPGERSLLKFLQGIVVTLLFGAIAAAVPFIEQQSINWHTVLTVVIGTFGTTLAFALQKYFTAQGDVPAAVLAGDAGTIIGQKTGLNDVKSPV